MTLRTFVERARRASRRSPAYLARRVKGAAAARLQPLWVRLYPRLLTERTLRYATGARSIDGLWDAQQDTPFFLSPARRTEWVHIIAERDPQTGIRILESARRAMRHEFDLLGSGPTPLGPKLPWHTDFKTGRTWPLDYARTIQYDELDRPTDVKVPWELSRSQHFTALGQAYWLSGDETFASEFVSEVEDWIASNRWGYGVNWACAMDVALRAVSWIWGFYFMAASPACSAPAFRGAFLRALYLHGEYIATHLERADVNGNHYLCDGVGLVFLGGFFRSTAKGRRWLAIGRDIVVSEIFNQTTEDGVDFEQSTAYHRLVLEAFLTSYLLLDLHGQPVPRECTERLERMMEFVEAYVKPDGSVPLFGDADDGRVQKLGEQDVNEHRYLLSTGAVVFGRGDFKRAASRFWDESLWLLGPDGQRSFDELAVATTAPASKAFAAGGFYVLRSQRAHVMIDCGEVGMDGRGGHGHNDILSLEIWLDGANLITDCGAYLYTASREWRNRFRSTAFHNVVQVDGEELNRFIAPDQLWQLHYDARPQEIAWRRDSGATYFRGGHSGYLRLHPPVTVTREVLLIDEGPDVVIRDTVGGSGAHELVWRFHLDPRVRATVDGTDIRLSTPSGNAWLQPIDLDAGFALGTEPGWVSPSYGVRRESLTVVITGRVTVPRAAMFRFGSARLPRPRLQQVAAELTAKSMMKELCARS